MINTLTFTNLYPNKNFPRHGIFIEHRIRNLVKSAEIKTVVLAPVPWVPRILKKINKYYRFINIPYFTKRYNIDIYHPRCIYIPKIGMSIAPCLIVLSIVPNLIKLIKLGYKIDIIDAYYFYPDGVVAAILGKIFKKKVALTALGSDVNILTNYFIPRLLIKWAANNVSGISTVSKSLKNKLIEIGVNQSNICTILHGVDLELFKPPENRDILRENLGITKFTILSAGNLIKIKGHDIVIEALSLLPDVNLFIAGNGIEEKKLKRLTNKLKLTNQVNFLGLVDQKELVKYYGAVDVTVLASSSEGIANVLLESIACGTPVITTNVGGASEIFKGNIIGKLIENRSVNVLVESVKSIMHSYPDRAQIRLYAENFKWERTTAEHIKFLKNILQVNN